jgi:hypothetical protein
MSDNIVKVYNEAVGGKPESDENIKARQAEAEASQKNIEAWGHWQRHAQTQVFIAKLNDVRNKMSVAVAHYGANVPDVSEHFIRARLAEIALLDEIIMRTVKTGELKKEMFEVAAPAQ